MTHGCRRCWWKDGSKDDGNNIRFVFDRRFFIRHHVRCLCVYVFAVLVMFVMFAVVCSIAKIVSSYNMYNCTYLCTCTIFRLLLQSDKTRTRMDDDVFFESTHSGFGNHEYSTTTTLLHTYRTMELEIKYNIDRRTK